MGLEQRFSVRPVTAGDGTFRSVRARNAHARDPGLAAEATGEERLDRRGRAQDRHWRVFEVGQVPVAADHGSGGRRLGEGEEVVIVGVPADGRAVRRIREAMAAPGDLGDEGPGLLCGGISAEFGSFQDGGQLGQKQGTGDDLDPLVDHRLPQLPPGCPGG